MSETQQDRELERYLQGNDPLSRAYDSLRDETPSPEMDRKVLHEARAAVSRIRRFPAWQSYTAIAATVVLAFAMVLRFDFDKPLQVEIPAPKSVPPSEASHEVPGDMSSPAAEPNAVPPADEVGLEAAPMPRPSVVQGTPVYTIQPDELGEAKRGESDSFAAEPDSRRAKAEVGPTRKAAAVGGGTRARLQQPAANMLEEKPVTRTPAPAAVQASPPAELQDRVEPSAPTESGQVQGVAAMSAEREQQLKEVTVTGSRMLARQPLAPEAWLQDIEELRKDGKVKEAEAEMRRFRLAYPEYQTGPDVAPTK